jgi:hypothetical protein
MLYWEGKMENREEIQGKLRIIQGWSNAELVEELRSPMRALCDQEVYVPLLVEAVARLLERKKGARGPKLPEGLRPRKMRKMRAFVESEKEI